MINESIKSKLRHKFYQDQHNQLMADLYWRHLTNQVAEITAYAMPTGPFGSNKTNQDARLLELSKMMADYVEMRYPLLKDNSMFSPEDFAVIDIPERMTLQAIDQRLLLFTYYLLYRTNRMHLLPFMKYDFFKSNGWFMNGSEMLLTYDEWLFENNYDNLIEVTYNIPPDYARNINDRRTVSSNYNWQ